MGYVVIRNSVDGLAPLFQLIGETADPSKDKLTLDLSESTFIEASMALLLAQLVIRLTSLNYEIRITWPNNPKVKRYLEQIRFQDFINTNYQQPTEPIEIPSLTALSLFRVSDEYIHPYIWKAEKYLGYHASGKDYSLIAYTLGELLRNVYDHATSPTGAYVFAQFIPAYKKITIVIGDLGVGITHKVNQYLSSIGMSTLSPKEALMKAFEPHFSTKSTPRNRGFGLDTVREMLLRNNGKLTVFVDNVTAHFTPLAQHVVFSEPIRDMVGTLLVLDIFVDKLKEATTTGENELDW